LIRHPNFNGMQKDPVTQGYTPARFLRTVDISLNGKKVLHLDISLAADPAITFGIIGQAGKRTLRAEDSDGAVFAPDFELAQGS
jgi:sulfur-oxidizing protein SoxY